MQAAAQAIGLASGPVTGGLLVAAAGWRWVFFLNVPVGVIAVLAGLYLLPRTRGLASAGQAGRERAGADPAGMTLLAMSATAGMLAVSALSGLNWPAWVVAGWAVTAVLTAVVLWRHENRARLRCWTSRRCGRPGLAGRSAAHCAPTSCCSARWCSSRRRSPRGAAAPWRRDFSSRRCRRASAWRRRLPTGSSGRGGLTGPAAPPEAGWPLAAPLASSPALRCSRPPAPRRRPRPPPSWRARCFSACSASAWGLHTPANNAEIMAVLPARDAATAGGMVNMARGIGTALGVAVVTLGLHAADYAGHPGAGPGCRWRCSPSPGSWRR